MSKSRKLIRARLGSGVARRARTLAGLVTILAVIATAVASPAAAYWTGTGTGSTVASTNTLSPPTDVTVPPLAAYGVTVGWTAGIGGITPTGYFVTRNYGGELQPACDSSATSLITDTFCTDNAVPDGIFRYTVTAVYASWTALSTSSAPVEVENAASLGFVQQPIDPLEGARIGMVTVSVYTADGDLFDGYGTEITISLGNNPGTGMLSGTLTTYVDITGVAVFDNLWVSQPGIGYTLIASSPGLADGTSDPFDISGFLQAAYSFSILSGAALVNTGIASVSGDVGVSPEGTITNLPASSVGGDLHVNDAASAAGLAAAAAAYTDLKGRSADAEITDIGGTFGPGVYHSEAALAITTTVTLDAGDDPNAVFVFQTDAAFNTAANSTVVLENGAQAANVYWVSTGAAGTGADSTLYGTILAEAAITLGARMILIGRALSQAAVTLAGNTIRFTDALPPTIAIDGGTPATTKDTTPTITGVSNAPAGSPVTVTVAGQTLTTAVSNTGTWTVTATELAAGPYDLVAKVRDPAGNGAAVTQVLTVEVNPDPVDLGSADGYAVLATTVTNTDATTVSGGMGVSPGDVVVGFPPGILLGTLDAGNAAAAEAQSDLAAAIIEISARTPHTEVVGDLGEKTFHLGIHHFGAAISLTGTVTLDAEDNPDAIFIFVTDAAFNTAADSVVVLANGAQAANVYWVVDGAAGTGARSTLSGSILARGAITLGADTALTGRALSLDALTMASSAIFLPGVAGRGLLQAVTESSESSPAGITDASQPAPVDDSVTAATTPGATTATTPRPRRHQPRKRHPRPSQHQPRRQRRHQLQK